MIRKLRLAACLFMVCAPFFYAQAQSGYIEESAWSNINPISGQASDFIITADGDKLFGVILRNYDYNNYDQVDFEHNGAVKTYFPGDLRSFGLENGRFFVSKLLPESSSLEFVQVLLSGRLQLDFKKGNYYLDNGVQIQHLRSYYRDVEGHGTSTRRQVKLYIATLKINTAGECGMELTDLIERSRIDEQDFIRILTQYHECENLPYKLHVEKIPFFKFSPTLALGVGMDLTKAPEIHEKTNYAFSNSMSYNAFVGFRLHDFRRFPKSSFDLRLGYIHRSATFNASSENMREVVTGGHEFSESNVVIPFSYNFSFVKKTDTDIYLGLVMSAWFTSTKTNMSILEFNVPSIGETLLYEQKIVSVKKQSTIPGIKLGASFPISSNWKFFSELQLDYLSDFYAFELLDSRSISVNRTYLSIKAGIEF
jgi:hypothetical protein